MLSTNSKWKVSKLYEIKVKKSFYSLLLANKYDFSSCSGVIITSEGEEDTEEDFLQKYPISKVFGKYKKFKMINDFPKEFKG